MKILRFFTGWLAAIVMLLIRWSCRIRWHSDPRPALREKSQPYAYAILHCHQVGAVIAGEPGTGAMVSRSTDGELLVPSLRVCGIVPVRGSTQLKGQDKGGAAALNKLIEHVREGAPAYLAVDGPRGPRNNVNMGIAKLAMATGATVITAIPVPKRRWILTRTWDRFQIPKPFTLMDVYFGEPLCPHERDTLEEFRKKVEDALVAIEEAFDPEEAAKGREAAAARRAKLERTCVEAKSEYPHSPTGSSVP